MPARYDWNKIRDDYVCGYKVTDPDTGATHITYPTHEDLSEKYGVTKDWLSKRSAKERWSQQRKIFSSEIDGYRKDSRYRVFFSDAAQLDVTILQATKNLVKVVSREIDKLRPDDDEEDGDEIEAPSPNNLLTLTRTLSELQALGRRACGEPVNGIPDQTLKNFKESAAPHNTQQARNNIDILLRQREELNKQLASITVIHTEPDSEKE